MLISPIKVQIFNERIQGVADNIMMEFNDTNIVYIINNYIECETVEDDSSQVYSDPIFTKSSWFDITVKSRYGVVDALIFDKNVTMDSIRQSIIDYVKRSIEDVNMRINRVGNINYMLAHDIDESLKLDISQFVNP
jgi:hypothetical protein